MRKKAQSGNVLFLILIAIALLGALTVLLSRTGSQSDDTGETEQMSVQVSEILKVASGYRHAVDTLIAQGCSETELSFAPNTLTSDPYYNPNSPTDLKCHLFHQNGAGLKPATIPRSILDTGQSAATLYGAWLVSGNYCIAGVGTGSSAACQNEPSSLELGLYLPYVKLDACKEINRRLGIVTPNGNPPADVSNAYTGNGQKFTGSLPNENATAVILDSATGYLMGKKAGCFEGGGTPASGTYHFYTVLIAR